SATTSIGYRARRPSISAWKLRRGGVSSRNAAKPCGTIVMQPRLRFLLIDAPAGQGKESVWPFSQPVAHLGIRVMGDERRLAGNGGGRPAMALVGACLQGFLSAPTFHAVAGLPLAAAS